MAIDIDKVMKLKALGVDFDDLTSDFTIAPAKQRIDFFPVPRTERWLLREFVLFTSGIGGALAIIGDGKNLFRATALQAPQFATIPLELAQIATDEVSVVFENKESLTHSVSYTIPIVRFPDMVYNEAVEVLTR